MPNPNKTYTINFNLVLDDHTDAMLIRLAADLSFQKPTSAAPRFRTGTRWPTAALRSAPTNKSAVARTLIFTLRSPYRLPNRQEEAHMTSPPQTKGAHAHHAN
ncbi:hypothetical protein LCGC14_1410620 [marine sediment metagenome]|uniref:Uncharacterized protein n=1 Tax=marine sediment metagenome TaxID=412755 RepID=A0A0F9M9S6_9ZZZZ